MLRLPILNCLDEVEKIQVGKFRREIIGPQEGAKE